MFIRMFLIQARSLENQLLNLRQVLAILQIENLKSCLLKLLTMIMNQITS